MAMGVKQMRREAPPTAHRSPPGGGARATALVAAAYAAAAFAAAGAGCGSKAPPTSGHSAAARPSATAAGPGTAAEMVNAVPAGRASSAFSFKFDIKARPSPDQPVDIEVALTPGSEFDRVQVTFHGNDGLEVRSGATMAPVERPEVGIPLHHTVNVVPKGAGIYSVSAVVQSESAEGSVSRTFAIPLIAGEGLAPPAPESASDATPPRAAAPAGAPTAARPHPAS